MKKLVQSRLTTRLTFWPAPREKNALQGFGNCLLEGACNCLNAQDSMALQKCRSGTRSTPHTVRSSVGSASESPKTRENSRENSPELCWLKCDEEIPPSTPPHSHTSGLPEEDNKTTIENDPRYLYPHFQEGLCEDDDKHDLSPPEVEYLRPNCYVKNYFTGPPCNMVDLHFTRSLQKCACTTTSTQQPFLQPYPETVQGSPLNTDCVEASSQFSANQLVGANHIQKLTLHSQVTQLDQCIIAPCIWPQELDQMLSGQHKFPEGSETSSDKKRFGNVSQAKLVTPKLNLKQAFTTSSSDEIAENALQRSTGSILDELLGIYSAPIHTTVATPGGQPKRQKITFCTNVPVTTDKNLNFTVNSLPELPGPTHKRAPERCRRQSKCSHSESPKPSASTRTYFTTPISTHSFANVPLSLSYDTTACTSNQTQSQPPL